MISLNPSSFTARLSLLLGAWLFAFSMAGFAQPNSSLTEKVKELANKHEGKVAVYIKHLESGEVTQLNADTPMPTASLIKFAIMVAAYKQVEAGKANLSTMVTLKKDDKVPGSGILTKNFSEGASFPLKDAIRLMIAYSDNTATNLVLDEVGIATVNQIIESLGYPNTKINAKVFKGSTTSVAPERTKEFGLGSTTAKETVELLEKVYLGKVASPESCKAVLEHLKQCEDKDMLPRHLPAGTVLAQKTGAVSDARTAGGIIYFKGGPIAICVLTTGNKDKSWSRNNSAEILVGAISKLAYDHYKTSK